MKLPGLAAKGILVATVLISLTEARSYHDNLPRSLLRNKRALNPIRALRNWWSGGNRLVPLGQYPLWKVHKYNGISLNPVTVVDSSEAGAIGPLPEVPGTPPPVVKIPHATYSPPDELEPPKTPYDPPSYSEIFEPRKPVYAPPQNAYDTPSEFTIPAPASPVYHAPQSSYAAPQSSYAAPQSSYAAPQSSYAAPQSSYATPQSSFSGPQSSFSVPNEYGPPSSFVDSSITGNSIDSTQPDVDGGADSGAGVSALDNLFSLSDLLPGSGSGLDLGTLAKIATSLPDGTVEKVVALLDLYNAKNNEERINALADAASAKVKLHADAANTTARLIEDLLIGKNGDSSNVPLDSGIYRDVPNDYPGRPGILPLLPPFSGASRNIPLPKLPEPPSLPSIPLLSGVKNLIRPPNLPYIYFPGKYSLPSDNVKGPYVSIKLPKPVTTYNVPNTVQSTYEAPKILEEPSPLYAPPFPEAITTFKEVKFNSAPTPPTPIYGTPVPNFATPVGTSFSVSQGDSNSFQPSPGSGYATSDVQVVPLPSFEIPQDQQNQVLSQTYGAPQRGFDHTKYAGPSSASLTSYQGENDVIPASSQRKETISRSAQELKTGYSRVVLQNAPTKENNNSDLPQQRDMDLRMYLDRNHPASTQTMHEQRLHDDEEELDGNQDMREYEREEQIIRGEMP